MILTAVKRKSKEGKSRATETMYMQMNDLARNRCTNYLTNLSPLLASSKAGVTPTGFGILPNFMS
jgi:hypothetical protein